VKQDVASAGPSSRKSAKIEQSFRAEFDRMGLSFVDRWAPKGYVDGSTASRRDLLAAPELAELRAPIWSNLRSFSIARQR